MRFILASIVLILVARCLKDRFRQKGEEEYGFLLSSALFILAGWMLAGGVKQLFFS